MADLLDIDFASGEPVDHTNGALLTRFGVPLIADDLAIGAKTATFDGIDDAYQVAFGDAYSVINTNRAPTFECVFKVNTVKSSTRVCSNIENAGIGFLLDNPATLQFAIHDTTREACGLQWIWECLFPPEVAS